MELNFKAFGQGEPIIILHGLFGTLDNWQTIAKQLAENYWVFIVDQRNHGRSPHLPDLSYPLMAADLKAFMDQQWIPRAHIIGHSMGGKTAMQFAIDYPDMVDKLIVVDIAPPPNEAGHQIIFDALFSIDLKTLEHRSAADSILEKRIADFGVRQFLLKNLSRNKEGGFRWKMNLEAIFNNYSNILAGIALDDTYDGETLFIKGARSDYIGTSQESVINQLFSDVDIAVIENAGHWVHADQPKALLDQVLTFLS